MKTFLIRVVKQALDLLGVDIVRKKMTSIFQLIRLSILMMCFSVGRSIISEQVLFSIPYGQILTMSRIGMGASKKI